MVYIKLIQFYFVYTFIIQLLLVPILSSDVRENNFQKFCDTCLNDSYKDTGAARVAASNCRGGKDMDQLMIKFYN